VSFDVPTLPLFIHERLSTKAILETLKGHRFDRNQATMFDLWGDPQHSVTDQVLRAYEHKDKWVNRMILGDSLVVINSLLHYEGLGGQVQMIYIDPPYGVRFGSNFQPFVRNREVNHNDDEHMTREPEMVQAYRDTWELGLHSYLTYLRDRLVLARELLHPSGSILVQIGDDNLHLVRCLMEEVFGTENFVSEISFRKTGSAPSDFVPNIADHIVWYAKSRELLKFRQLYRDRNPVDERMTSSPSPIPTNLDENSDAAPFQSVSLESAGLRSGDLNEPFEWQGRVFRPRAGAHWKTGHKGLRRLGAVGRLLVSGNTLRYKMLLQDFPVTPYTN
jgi:adenine-specific DNA-methyltransferase